MDSRYWQNFLLGATGVIVLLYVGKKLSTPKAPEPPTPK
jgi:hypothetical protein